MCSSDLARDQQDEGADAEGAGFKRLSGLHDDDSSESDALPALHDGFVPTVSHAAMKVDRAVVAAATSMLRISVGEAETLFSIARQSGRSTFGLAMAARANYCLATPPAATL